MTNKQIDNRVKKYLTLQAQIAALKAELDAVAAELKDELDVRKAESIITNNHVVKCTSYVRTTFDSKQFAVDHSRLYKQYQKESNCKRFSVQ